VEQRDLLQKAVKSLGISVYPGMFDKFSQYRDILLEWNRRINLISRNDEMRIVKRHFLQSIGLLKIVDFPLKARVMDLGTGAGFPGVPLKIVRPDLQTVLVESKQKKGIFLLHLIEQLGLKETEVVWGRIEEMKDRIDPVDFVVSRGVTDLVTLFKWSRDFLKPQEGKLVALKGSGVERELERLRKGASAMGVKQWERVRYNPFPHLFQLRESWVVVVVGRG